MRMREFRKHFIRNGIWDWRALFGRHFRVATSCPKNLNCSRFSLTSSLDPASGLQNDAITEGNFRLQIFKLLSGRNQSSNQRLRSSWMRGRLVFGWEVFFWQKAESSRRGRCRYGVGCIDWANKVAWVTELVSLFQVCEFRPKLFGGAGPRFRQRGYFLIWLIKMN